MPKVADEVGASLHFSGNATSNQDLVSPIVVLLLWENGAGFSLFFPFAQEGVPTSPEFRNSSNDSLQLFTIHLVYRNERTRTLCSRLPVARNNVRFPALFSTIEEVLQNPDHDIDSLIAIGLFEDMQNIASHREFGAEPFRKRLGARSLQIWDEVDEGMKRVVAWQKTQKPKWWQFWRKRKTLGVEKALSQVQSPELRKILEAEYRSKR